MSRGELWGREYLREKDEEQYREEQRYNNMNHANFFIFREMIHWWLHGTELLKRWVGFVSVMLPPNDVEWVAWKIQRWKRETLPPRTMNNLMMNYIFKKENKNRLNLVQSPLTSPPPPNHPSVSLLQFEDTQQHHIYLVVDNKASVSVSFAAPPPL